MQGAKRLRRGHPFSMIPSSEYHYGFPYLCPFNFSIAFSAGLSVASSAAL